MKRILIAACLALGLAGCQQREFSEGDMVAATVGIVHGNSCLIAIQIRSSPTTRPQAIVARFDTEECRAK